MAVTSRVVAIHDHHTWTGFGSSRFNSREPKHSYSIQYIKIVSKHSVDLKLATAQETVEPAYCFARGRLEKVCMRHVFYPHYWKWPNLWVHCGRIRRDLLLTAEIWPAEVTLFEVASRYCDRKWTAPMTDITQKTCNDYSSKIQTSYKDTRNTRINWSIHHIHAFKSC